MVCAVNGSIAITGESTNKVQLYYTTRICSDPYGVLVRKGILILYEI
jgi:hypothetical protein